MMSHVPAVIDFIIYGNTYNRYFQRITEVSLQEKYNQVFCKPVFSATDES